MPGRARSVGEGQAGLVRHRGHAAEREGRGPPGGGDHDNSCGLEPVDIRILFMYLLCYTSVSLYPNVIFDIGDWELL